MTKPRSTLICLDSTPWYHLVNRCVRRAFLCGYDKYSERSYEHRREWIVRRIKQLASVFAIDVAAYAVMSNHYHLVVRVDVQRCQQWSTHEVLRRWQQLFNVPELVKAVLTGQIKPLDKAALRRVNMYAETYRSRLQNISWFMRILNETIARQANKEEDVTGRFWEGRFKSQALLDEAAVLSAMTYVDLNPIRAGLAKTLETSEYTSIAERLASLLSQDPETKQSDDDSELSKTHWTEIFFLKPKQALHQESQLAHLALQPLMPFDSSRKQPAAIMFSFYEYVKLLETTGRAIRPDKPGYIPVGLPRILERLGLKPEAFIDCAKNLLRYFSQAIGSPDRLDTLRQQQNLKHIMGITAAKALFG